MLSFEEALEFLEERKIQYGDRAIFRGEANSYNSTPTSLDRLPQDMQVAFEKMLPNLALHLMSQKLSHHLEDSAGFVLYQGKPFGANNLLDPEDLEPRHTSRGLIALMQHYGIPTSWVDFTKEPKVALLFASQDSNSDIGYIHYGDYSSLSGLGILIDLQQFVCDLRQILPFPITRPEKQHALAFRPVKGLCGRSGTHTIKFIKPTNPLEKLSSLFPKDAMRVWFMGQIVDYYVDYVERSRRSNLEVRKAYPSADSLRQALESIMSDFELWY